MRFFATLLMTTSILLCAVSASAEDPLQSEEEHRQALFDKLAPSVVFISNGKGIGSGFFISSEGAILTNAHVVGKETEVTVVTHDGKKLKGRVVERVAVDGGDIGKALTEGLDLAVVKVEHRGKPVEIASLRDLKVGSWVGAIGHNEGFLWTFTTGMVSNLYPQDREKPFFQTQIPINPGNSGGPIFDRRGRVVGIATIGVIGSNSLNFAIPIEVATRRLKTLRTNCECVSITVPGKIPIYVNGKMVGNGPGLLIPTKNGTVLEIMVIIDGQMRKRKVRYPDTKEVNFK